MPIGGGGSTITYRLATLAILEEEDLEVHEDIVAGEVYLPDVWHNSIWFEWEVSEGDVLYDSMMSIGGPTTKGGIAWLARKQQSNAVWFFQI